MHLNQLAISKFVLLEVAHLYWNHLTHCISNSNSLNNVRKGSDTQRGNPWAKCTESLKPARKEAMLRIVSSPGTIEVSNININLNTHTQANTLHNSRTNHYISVVADVLQDQSPISHVALSRPRLIGSSPSTSQWLPNYIALSSKGPCSVTTSLDISRSPQ